MAYLNMTHSLGPGVHPDVQWFDGVWLVACQRDDLLVLSMHSREGEAIGALLDWPLGGTAGSFVRLHVWQALAWIARRDGAPPYHGQIWALGTMDMPIDLGVVHGAFPIAMGDGMVAYQAGGSEAGYPVATRALGQREGGTVVRHGVGVGLSRVMLTNGAAHVTTQDDDRHAVPGVVDPSWTLDGSCVVGATDRGGQPCAVARLRDGREAELWRGQDSQNPRVATDGYGRYAVVAWSGRGEGVRLQILQADRDFRAPVEPDIEPLAEPVWIGAFYLTTDRYAERIRPADYPHTCEVLADEPDVAARATGDVLVGRAVLGFGVITPEHVIGLYVGKEAPHDEVEAEVQALRRVWRQQYGARPVPAVVAYVTPAMRDVGFDRQKCSADLWAPEFYFSATTMPSPAGVREMAGAWIEAGFDDRPWLPACQAYDRNVVVSPAYITALAGCDVTFLELCRVKAIDVRGLLWFAVNRASPDLSIGGVCKYPELLESHRHVFAAVPSGPIRGLPVRPVSPPVPPVVPPVSTYGSMTITEYESVARDRKARAVSAPDKWPYWSLWIEWMFRKVGEERWTQQDARRNPRQDPDHTFRFHGPGTYEIGLRWESGQTGKKRIVTVS